MKKKAQKRIGNLVTKKRAIAVFLLILSIVVLISFFVLYRSSDEKPQKEFFSPALQSCEKNPTCVVPDVCAVEQHQLLSLPKKTGATPEYTTLINPTLLPGNKAVLVFNDKTIADDIFEQIGGIRQDDNTILVDVQDYMQPLMVSKKSGQKAKVLKYDGYLVTLEAEPLLRKKAMLEEEAEQ